MSFFESYQPKNILIVNTYGIGDCLFTTPFLRQLCQSFPQVRISYVANRRVGNLLENHPDIERIFVYERDEFDALQKKSKREYVQAIDQFVQTIQEQTFDMVFDFSMNASINFFVWKTKIPHRMGFNYKNRSKFLTYKKDIRGFEGQHVAQYYLDLLQELGVSTASPGLELYVDTADQQWVLQQFEKQGISDQRVVIGVVPGGGASWGKDAALKRWPASNYRKLVEKCVEKFKGPIILMGDSSEEALCSDIAADFSDIHNFCGQTSLGQLAALIQKCDIVIVNDGGPLHMAVAVGTRSVSIFGPVDEHVYGPFGDADKHRVVTQNLFCRPCYRSFRMSQCDHLSCLNQIDVSTVIQKIEELI